MSDGVVSTAVERFEALARQAPQRLAVMTRDAVATYGQLSRAANRLARAMAAADPDATTPVAVLCGDDMSWVRSILAALKLGRPYVPLEPAQPPARIAALLGDAGATLVCTDHASVALAREAAGGRRVLNVLDIGEPPDDDLGIAVAPDTPAYVLYTSGSTGRPKGVVHTQRSVAALARRHAGALALVPTDRVVLLAARAAAQAAHCLFVTLLGGAALYPFRVRDEGLRPLGPWLRQNRITIWHSSASLFRYFAEQLPAGETLPDLRIVKLGSEPVVAGDLALFRRRFAPPCVLVNALSSTETGTVLQHVVAPDAVVAGGLVPVGRPLEDVEVELCDEAGRPVAPGAVGEIVVRSPVLAAGYWKQAAATAAAFEPAAPEAGTPRRYRMGDLGRRLADGTIVHVGRRDALVKIRGQRVSVAEVEAALLGLPAVREAAVVVRPDARGEPRLVAYAATAAEPAALRAALRDRLPEHMVPAAVVPMAALPRTATGKVDRPALPDETAARAPRAPRTPLEARLLPIWRRVLEVESLGVDDDFFQAGGHSLLAAALFAEIETVLGRSLPLGMLVEAPTIARLADAIERMPPWSPLVAVRASGRRRPFFCVHGGRGNVVGLAAMAEYLDPEQPFFAFQAVGVDGLRPPLESIETMAALYVGELRRVQPRGPYRLGGLCVGGVVAFEMARQLRGAGDAVELLVVLDTLEAPGTPPWVRWGRRSTWWQALRRAVGRGPRAHFRYSDDVFQATERARKRYRPGRFDGAITFIRLDPAREAAARERRWRRLANGGLVVHTTPGDHGEITRDALPGLARTLNACLATVAAADDAA